jgi:hypothetical protein
MSYAELLTYWHTRFLWAKQCARCNQFKPLIDEVVRLYPAQNAPNMMGYTEEQKAIYTTLMKCCHTDFANYTRLLQNVRNNLFRVQAEGCVDLEGVDVNDAIAHATCLLVYAVRRPNPFLKQHEWELLHRFVEGHVTCDAEKIRPLLANKTQ